MRGRKPKQIESPGQQHPPHIVNQSWVRKRNDPNEALASVIIPLDSGPLGLLVSTEVSAATRECHNWVDSVIAAGTEIVLPEIVLYELRRELLRLNKRKSLRHLDVLKSKWTFQPITTPAMDKAAEFWAASRKRGTPTASEKALDIDVILAAQAWEMTLDGSFVLIATTNQKHLAQYVPAEHWKDIHP